MPDAALRTLVLYADYTSRLSYFDDWLDAFHGCSEFDVTAVNICPRSARAQVRGCLRDAELIVLLHSTNGDTTEYLEPYLGMLQDRRGVLLSFVGNEVNLPGAPLSAKRELFRRIEPEFIATQLPLEAGQYLYSDQVRTAVITVPHALNPEQFRVTKALRDRGIDVGVRSVRYLPHLGDNDRNRLYDYFLAHGSRLGLAVDISTQRLTRTNWATYLNECRATVSTEAGSWYLERDDRTVEAIRAWTAHHQRGGITIRNDSRLQRLGHRLPWALRVALKRLLSHGPVRHEASVSADLGYEEVFARFFKHYAKPNFYGKCISSRHFDAIGTETCQIMFPGRFNDILRADEHYLALNPDFSNIDDVLRRFRDDGEVGAMVTRAREFAMDCHTYRRRMAEIYAAVQGRAARDPIGDRSAVT